MGYGSIHLLAWNIRYVFSKVSNFIYIKFYSLNFSDLNSVHVCVITQADNF